jgi:hypothetical protein
VRHYSTVSNDRISVHTSDLAEYVGRNSRLSDDVGGATEQHLGGHLSISGNMFGDLGHESGLHNTVGDHINRMHGHVHKLAGSVRDLGHAVHGAKGDYEANEDLYASNYGKIMGE